MFYRAIAFANPLFLIYCLGTCCLLGKSFGQNERVACLFSVVDWAVAVIHDKYDFGVAYTRNTNTPLLFLHRSILYVLILV